MNDKLLGYYLDQQAALIGLRFKLPDGSLGDLRQEWTCGDMAFDPRGLFAWWWTGDDPGGKVIWVDRIETDDFAVLLHFIDGAVEIGPAWTDEHKARIAGWYKETDREAIRGYLRGAIETVAEKPKPQPLPKPPVRAYQALLEWSRVEDSDDRWVLAAAWAASEDELAIVADDRYRPLEDLYSDVQRATDPLGALDYWWRQADEVLTRRGRIEPVQAASARDAATIALAHGWPKDYLDSEFAVKTGSVPDSPAGAGRPGAPTDQS